MIMENAQLEATFSHEGRLAVAHLNVAPTPTRTAPVSGVGISSRQLGVGLSIAGWAALGLMWVTGSAAVFGHDQSDVSAILALALFLVGWVVMVAAMMLPSSVPTLARIDHALGSAHAGASRFMVGYFLAWATFGGAAFAGDGILHLLVERVPWLAQRTWLIAGGAAMFAGAAEMLGRPPPAVFTSITGDEEPLALGKAHALDRIRRCWPLMLFAMAIGMNSPGWMVGLTLVMALELLPRATAALRLIGLALFSVGIAVVVEPGWMPTLLGSV